MNIVPGDVIAERYRIEEQLGEGGMALVFRALHLKTDQRRALKVVRPDIARKHPQIIERFVQEARITARIGDCEHIVRIDDADVDPTKKIPFLAMELLKGRTLETICREGPMPAALVTTLFRQLGEALSQAHAAAVVHRDLKPANLFLVHNRKNDPILKVTDFGIAKLLSETSARTGTQIGTPGYAAPEQLGLAHAQIAASSGVTIARTVSPATDVWPLAVIAYEMLTGFDSEQFWGVSWGEVQLRTVMSAAPRATERAGERASLLPRDFDAWCAQCLQRDASQRFQSVDAAIAAFGQLFEASPRTVFQAPVLAPPPAPPPPPDAPTVPPGETQIGSFVAPTVIDPTPEAAPIAPYAPPPPKKRTGIAILAIPVAIGLGGVSWRLLSSNDEPKADTKGETAPAAEVGPTVTLGTRVWQREGSAEGMSWSAAKEHCGRFAGWELPSHDALIAAMKANGADQALDWRGYYWSSTPGDGGAEGMAVTSSGRRESSAQTNLFKVRCVQKGS